MEVEAQDIETSGMWPAFQQGMNKEGRLLLYVWADIFESS